MRAFPDNFAALVTSMTTVSPSDVLNCLKIPKNLSKDDITTISPSDVLDCFKIPKNLSEDDITTIPCLRKFTREATKEGSYINFNT